LDQSQEFSLHLWTDWATKIGFLLENEQVGFYIFRARGRCIVARFVIRMAVDLNGNYLDKIDHVQ
jgi:hypothetical protein